MRGSLTVTAILMSTSLVLASERPAADQPCLSLRLLNRMAIPQTAVLDAQRTVTAIFDKVGTTVEWNGRNPHCRKLELMFDQPNPPDPHPEALAYALPFQNGGTRIFIFYSRVRALVSADNAGTTLGYVIAHEVCHVLEGQSRHSSAGIMKARWESRDFHLMAGRRLQFAPEDADWIIGRTGPDTLARR